MNGQSRTKLAKIWLITCTFKPSTAGQYNPRRRPTSKQAKNWLIARTCKPTTAVQYNSRRQLYPIRSPFQEQGFPYTRPFLQRSFDRSVERGDNKASPVSSHTLTLPYTNPCRWRPFGHPSDRKIVEEKDRCMESPLYGRVSVRQQTGTLCYHHAPRSDRKIFEEKRTGVWKAPCMEG